MSPLPSLQHRVVRLDNSDDVARTRRKRTSTQFIIWHCTAGDRAKDAINWMNRADVVAAYHYVIDRDGTIYRHADPQYAAPHAGDSAWPLRTEGPKQGTSLNPVSLGVSFANDNGSDGDERDDPLTPAQIESGLWLGVTLMRLYNVPPECNLGHLEVSPKRKFDPLPRILNMDEWRRRLAAAARL